MTSLDSALEAAERAAGRDAALLPEAHLDSAGERVPASDAADEAPGLHMKRLSVFQISAPHGEPKPVPPFLTGSYLMFTASKFNLLLAFLPLGIAAELLGWSDGAIFGLNCVAILPLAKLLGDATEQVATHTNETIGGLLNATFGNATELIVSVFALEKGLLGVVKTSLLGSIISNTLLVLGMACIAGGITKPVQTFNSTAASANTTLLLMSILGMSIPACLASLGEVRPNGRQDLMISRFTAIVLLFLYCLYIYFQLVTHRKYFEAPPKPAPGVPSGAQPPGVHASSKHASSSSFVVEADEDEEQVLFSLKGALFWLAAVTVLIAFLSEFLTGAIEGAARRGGLATAAARLCAPPPHRARPSAPLRPSPHRAGATKDYSINQSFVGFVILPIVGNAAEHATAVTMAYKSKMDLALGVALGSATQISLFVVPFMVLLGWAIGQPLDLFFGAYETAITFVATVVVGFAVADGETNWLEVRARGGSWAAGRAPRAEGWGDGCMREPHPRSAPPGPRPPRAANRHAAILPSRSSQGASLLSAYVIIGASFLFYEHKYA